MAEGSLTTAAFWGESHLVGADRFFAAEPWTEVWKNGGHLVRRQMLAKLGEALAEWQLDFDLSEEMTDVAGDAFARRVNAPGSGIRLSPRETERLTRAAISTEQLKQCEEVLVSLGKVTY
jgi:hypothetical protein